MSNIRIRPTKDSYFMGIAESVKLRSPDPKTQVGAVIVDMNNRIISTGFNGPPAGCADSEVDWLDRESVYPIVVHAEMNAILYAGSRFDGSKLYVTLSPCKECIKLVAASGIKSIIYKDRYKDIEQVKKLADFFGVKLIQFEDNSNG